MTDKDAGSNVTRRVKSIVHDMPFLCKIIELMICIVVVGLIVDPFQSQGLKPDVNHAGIVHVSICGYVLINAIVILCYLLGERQPKKMSVIFSGVGGILCCVSGIVLIHNWTELQENIIYSYYERYSNQLIAGGVFAILAAIVFLIEAVLTYIYE